MQSVIPHIEQTIENLERVRRFVTKALNVDLQKAMVKLDARKDLNPKQRVDEEVALRRRLEIDWGTIPGVDKPFLMQPGAEKFLLWLNLRPRYTVREMEAPGGHLEVVASVTMYSKKTGEEVFQGPDCSCSTMETNFRYVWAETVKPPDDIVDTLKAQRMGRNFKQVKWVKGNRIEQWVWQQRVEKPNIYDERNKVRQIGQKRALVKGVRNLGALSQIFTADPSEWEIEPDDGGPEDEMDYTPSGRRIITAEGTSPSGRYQDTQRPAKEARGPAVESAPQVQGPAPYQVPQVVTAPAASAPDSQRPKHFIPKEKSNGKIVLTWPATDDGCAYLSGDLARILPEIQKAMLCTWFPNIKCHVIPATEASALRDIVVQHGYEYVEVSGSLSPAAPATPGTARQPDAAGDPKGATDLGRSAAPSAAQVIQWARPGKTTKTQAQYMDVKYGGYVLHCYNKDLHPFLSAGEGKEAELILDKKKCVVGIKRIGTRMFDADGKTPIVQLNEERPTTTASLFS